MNKEMQSFFHEKIKALVVEDDARFLAKSSKMLSLLNFKVGTCKSPSSALKLLTGGKIKDVDVVLINAAKVATCGFDFRGIVEPDLNIPVVYFLPLDHKLTGDEADRLLHTLRTATYIIKKPLDAKDLQHLWRVIAWHKNYLKVKPKPSGHRHMLPAAAMAALVAGSTIDEEKEEEECIYFKEAITRTGGRGRKRKNSSNPGGSSGTRSLAGDHPGKRQGQQINVTEGQEMGNVASQQQEPQDMGGRQQQQQNVYEDLIRSSINNIAAFACASNNAALPPPPLPPVYRVPAPAPRPVYSAPAPTPALPPTSAPCPVYSAPAPAPAPALMNPTPSLMCRVPAQTPSRVHSEPVLQSPIYQAPPQAAPALSSPVNPTPATAPVNPTPALMCRVPAQTPSRVYSAPLLHSPVHQASPQAAAPALPPRNPTPAPARARLPVNPVPAPAPSRVYPAPSLQPPVNRAPALPQAPANHQQQPMVARDVLDTIAPSASVTTNVTCEPQYAQQVMFRPFSCQSPRSPVMQQRIFDPERPGSGMWRREDGSIMLSFKQPPAGGDPFTGNARACRVNFGASASATAAHSGGHANTASLLLQSLNLGTDDDDDALELSALMAMYPASSPAAIAHNNYSSVSAMVAKNAAAIEALNGGSSSNYNAGSLVASHQHAGHDNAAAAMGAAPALGGDNFSNCNTGSRMAPDQVLGMASSNVNELTVAGAALGGSAAAASSMAPQNLVAAPNQLAPETEDDIFESLMDLSQGHGSAMDGNDGFAAMLPSDENEEDTTFRVEDLLDLDDADGDASMREAGPDGQPGGTTGGTAAAADAAGTSLIGGGAGTGTCDNGAADDLDILLHDFFRKNGTGDLLFPNDVNNGRK